MVKRSWQWERGDKWRVASGKQFAVSFFHLSPSYCPPVLLSMTAFGLPHISYSSLSISFVFKHMCLCLLLSLAETDQFSRVPVGQRGTDMSVFNWPSDKKASVSCVQWGWGWVVISEAVWKQRLLLLASQRMCEERPGQNVTHLPHTMLAASHLTYTLSWTTHSYTPRLYAEKKYSV